MAFYVMAACVFIPAIGPEEDEVQFINAIYHPTRVHHWVTIAGHAFPTMLVSYVGVDKSYIYKPILAIFQPSLWALRLPIVLIGALSLWLLFVAVRRLTNAYAAAAAVCFIATDPIYLLTGTFDWGPVALQHVFMIAALACLARRKPMVFGGFLFIGLALWEKGTAIWIIAAFLFSASIFAFREITDHITPRNAAKAAGGFVLGALPFLIFNLENHWATFHDNAGLSLAGLSHKLDIMEVTLTGRSFFGWMMLGPMPQWYSLMPLGLAAAAILMFHPRLAGARRPALFALFTGLLTWAAMLVSRGAGDAVHHVILVWPWLQIFTGCVLAYTLPKKPFLAASALLVISNVAMLGIYAQRAHQYGPGPGWSNATLKLPGALPKGKEIVTLDWGIVHIVNFLTRGKADVNDVTFSGVSEANLPQFEKAEFFTHVDGQEMLAGKNAAFDAVMHKLGFVRVIDQILTDSKGRPFIVSFHCVHDPARVSAPTAERH